MHNPFYLVYLLILFLCLLIGWGCSKYFNRPFLLILVQITLACITEILAKTVIKENNAILFNLYILPEIWLCGLSLSILLASKAVPFFLGVLLLASAIWGVNMYLAGPLNFANYAYLLSGLLLGTACIITIIQNLRKGILPFQSKAVAYLLAGLAAYYFCNVPLWSLLMAGLISTPVVSQLFAINLLLASLKYALISFAFLQHKNEQKDKILPPI